MSSKERDVEEIYGIAAGTPPRKMEDVKKELHIDLYNFEDPDFDDSKYILTSPRSLEACSRLGIKPVELLYRPLVDYQEELIPKGISMRTVYEVFDEQEKLRLNKLQMCRDERTVVVKEEHEVEKQKRRAKGNENAIDEIVLPDSTKPDKPTDKGSIQRKRTAWATSVGHQRVTSKEIDQRAEEIHKKGEKLRNKTLRGGLAKPRKPGAAAARHAKWPMRLRKKQERQKRKEKSSSFSDVSSIASSSRSSLSPWLRDPAQEARPITNPTLRKTLHSAKSGTRVTPRDQKILELMMQKGEQAKATKRNSDIARSNWELERQQEAKARKAAEIRRRHSIQEGRKAKDMQRGQGTKRTVVCTCRDVERRRVNGFSSHHHDHDHEDDGKGCDRGMHSPSQRQLELKRRQAEDKRLQNVAKQKAAEERIKQQQRDKEEFAAAIKEKQQRDLNRASSMKEAKEKEIILKTKLKNFHARKKSEERLSQIRKQKEEDLQGLKASIALKQQAADYKTHEEKRRKEEAMKRNQRELSKKLELSKKSQKQLDEEMEEWKKDLLSYRKMQEQRAEEIAQEKLKEKKRKAHEERIAKESKAKENMKKMLEQEEEWRADVEATIAMKDAKSKMLQMEKEEMIEESRALAQASQQLREELRSHYAKDNLETLNRQAELETKIINKGMSGIKLS